MIDTDFINRPSDGLRVYLAGAYALTTIKFNDLQRIVDYGCGTGGLLKFLKHNIFDRTYLGYDIVQDNVQHCKDYGLSAECKDITKDNLYYGDLAIATEILEHLLDPREFLNKIPNGTWLIASVPANENDVSHDPSHIQIWQDDSFVKMVSDCGFVVYHFDKAFISQFVVAKKRE